MDKIVFVFFAACIAMCSGGGYGNYPGNGYYPGGGGYYPANPGYYPGQGNYPSGGNYPGGGYRPPGPPGDHPGCPLCDSSVYDYCSYKEAHDACCCGGGGGPFGGYGGGYGCQKASCRKLYANSCEESQLISRCCCVDLQKNAIAAPVPVAIV